MGVTLVVLLFSHPPHYGTPPAPQPCCHLGSPQTGLMVAGGGGRDTGGGGEADGDKTRVKEGNSRGMRG